ncbi:MAG: DUF2007 domain-containing protein [Planctomycetota bacterium]|nr:DUF2007 domain-containing protein [Planctomycetota bacterium]
MTDFVEVLVARDIPHAYIVKGMLDDAGIPAFVENEELQNAIGELATGFSTAPRVVVAQAHAERALELLREFERSPDAAE